MDTGAVWTAIDDQRVRTAALLDGLTDAEWGRPSLCADWTVRDVAAHLTLQQVSLFRLVPDLVRSRGDANAMVRDVARRKAAGGADRFGDELRAMVGSRRRVTGMSPLDTLGENLVHAQDIAVPLGRALETASEPAGWAASRVWGYGGRGVARLFHRLPVHGLTLTATDLDWTVGAGPEVRGPIAGLLLLLTGRRVALDWLEGEGLAVLESARS